MAKYHIETTNGTYEVETDEAPPLGEQPATFGGVAKTMASQAGSALGTAASDIAGAPAAIAGAIRHPIDTLKSGISSPKAPQIPESQMPQDTFHRAQRALGGGPNYHPMGENTPTSEVVGHGLALGAMSAAPSVIGKIPQAVDTAMERFPQGGGINPDVRAGAVKMAAGAAGAELLPGPLKWPARIMGVYPGARQLWRGMTNPDAYAQEAVSDIPTIKAPPPNAPPAVFGDPEGFSKLPPSVQEAIMRGAPSAPVAPAPATPMPLRGMEHYGIIPKESTAAPAPTITSPNLSNALSSLRQKAGIPEGETLGASQPGKIQPRFDEGSGPTMKSAMANTKYIRVNPEELGVHGGVEGTPIRGPLNTPEKIRIAKQLADELKKGGK